MSVDATKELQRIAGNLGNHVELRKRVGKEVMELFQAHLVRLESSRPNKKGFPRAHWYSKAAKQTHFKVTELGAQVSVSMEGFNARVQGATILPVNVKALTIPETAEAYRHEAKDKNYWSGSKELSYVPINKGNVVGALVKRHQKGKENEFVYLLLRKSVLKPDPSLVPGEDKINGAVKEALDRFLSTRKN